MGIISIYNVDEYFKYSVKADFSALIISIVCYTHHNVDAPLLFREN